jgi:hypothetical protein
MPPIRRGTCSALSSALNSVHPASRPSFERTPTTGAGGIPRAGRSHPAQNTRPVACVRPFCRRTGGKPFHESAGRLETSASAAFGGASRLPSPGYRADLRAERTATARGERVASRLPAILGVRSWQAEAIRGGESMTWGTGRRHGGNGNYDQGSGDQDISGAKRSERASAMVGRGRRVSLYPHGERSAGRREI